MFDNSDEEKERCVREAIKRVPRPFILYTTLREDAERYSEVLREQGIRRAKLVMGGTSGLEETLLAWERREVDVVVATSAFGLGVDNNEVRAVLHACVPETVDRFYQEVGRAGRDGRAAVSLTVFSDSDLDTARGLAKPKLISPNTSPKGWLRWSHMWRNRREGHDGRFLLDLSSVREGLDGEGVGNRKWNERTLGLMARAGIIRLRTPVPQLPDDMDPESEAFQRVLEDKYSEVYVELRDALMVQDRDRWTELVGQERERALGRAEKDLRRLEAAFFGTTAMNAIFADTYTIPGLEVERGPGRCPVTRGDGTASTLHALPCPSAPSVDGPSIESALINGAGTTYVTYDAEMLGWRESVRVVVEAASRLGFVDFVLPRAVLRETWPGILHKGTGFVILRDLDDAQCVGQRSISSDLAVPRVVLVPPDRRSDQVPAVHLLPYASEKPGMARLILFEKSMEVPDQPGWLFADKVTVMTDCPRFMEMIE